MTPADLARIKQLAEAAPDRISQRLGHGGPTESEQFYAAARTDVQALIAEVERLRAENERLRPVYEAAKVWRTGDDDAIDILNVDHERFLVENNERLKMSVDAAVASERSDG